MLFQFLLCFLKFSICFSYILYATEKEIKLISNEENANNSRVIYNASNKIIDFDYDYENKFILWRDSNAVQNVSSDNYVDYHNFSYSLAQELILKTDYTYRAKLAIDWIHNLVYFIDNERLIVVSANDSLNRYTVVEKQVKDIAINPINYFIIWSRWDTNKMNASIMKANYDGSNQTVLIDFDIKEPNALVIDLKDSKIYWIDRQLYTLSSVDYNGNDRRLIKKSKLYFEFTLDIDVNENYIYWSNAILDAIIRIEKNDNRMNFLSVVKENSNIDSFKIISKSRQPNNNNQNVCFNRNCILCLPISLDQFSCPLDDIQNNFKAEYEELSNTSVDNDCNGSKVALPVSITAIILSIISVFVLALYIYFIYPKLKRSTNKPNHNERVIFDKDLKHCYILEPLLGDNEDNVNVYEEPKHCVNLESTHEEFNESVFTKNEVTDI